MKLLSCCVASFALATASVALGQDGVAAVERSTQTLAAEASRSVVAVLGTAKPGTIDDQANRTGFLIDAEGHILTEADGVARRRRVEVRFAGPVRAQARVVGTDPLTGVALLKLEEPEAIARRLGGKLHPLALASAGALQPGHVVFSLSNAFDSLAVDGIPTFSRGVVSAFHRPEPARVTAEISYRGLLITTDAAVNPGAFGGPLLDRDGRVVGVLTRAVPTGQWLGAAIPADPIARSVEALKAGQPPRHGRLGLFVRGTGGEARPGGLEVVRIEPASAAARAGLQAGDRLVAVDGVATVDATDLGRALTGLPSGAPVRLKVLRGERVVTLHAALDPAAPVVLAQAPGASTPLPPAPTPAPATTPRPTPGPTQPRPQPAAPARAQPPTLGLALKPRAAGGLEVAEVAPGGPGQKAGITRGDVILAFGGQRTNDFDALGRALGARKPGDRVAVRVERDGWTQELTVELAAAGPALAQAGEPGYLGVMLAPAEGGGVLVRGLVEGSPAGRAGVAEGDKIVGLDRAPVRGPEDLVAALRGKHAGDRVRLEVERAGARREVTVTLAPRPAATPAPAPPAPPPAPTPAQAAPWLGAALVASGGRVTVESVDPRGPAAKAGLAAGDVVLAAQERPLRDLDGFDAAFRPLRAGDTLRLLVERGGWQRTLEIQLARRP